MPARRVFLGPGRPRIPELLSRRHRSGRARPGCAGPPRALTLVDFGRSGPMGRIKRMSAQGGLCCRVDSRAHTTLPSPAGAILGLVGNSSGDTPGFHPPGGSGRDRRDQETKPVSVESPGAGHRGKEEFHRVRSWSKRSANGRGVRPCDERLSTCSLGSAVGSQCHCAADSGRFWCVPEDVRKEINSQCGAFQPCQTR